MAAGTASLCLTLLFVVLVSAEQKYITAESGQNVTLPCRAPNKNNKIMIVEWSRVDLDTKYVLVYRDGHFIPDDQHPSFKKRVDLQDRQMKDGDVSLILRDVMTDDEGTYECRVFMETRSWKHSSISLRVLPPGQRGGRREDEEEEKDGAVGLIVSALLLVAAVVGFVI